MRRRSGFAEPATIDVQGVLGTFKVPRAHLTVEYVLTYAALDGGKTANGQLLDLLVPVREVFRLEDLDFDHLLQRDLDDFRVSEEMVPYLLGETSSEPRFFPPIVAIIAPMSGEDMNDFYPQCSKTDEIDQGVPLKVFNYGNVFSVKREVRDEQDEQEEQEEQEEQLAQSPVDLCIHPTQAKLVIVDGQHRAMAMLAAYRSASNKWSGNEFQHFYQGIDPDISELRRIHLPVCIAYFPELTQDTATTQMETLTTACRRFFLDVNRNARQPSESRQILLDDTDLVACFTRHLFNIIKKNTKAGSLQLHHTEYDNPRDRARIFRPFAVTDVYTLFSIVRSVLLLNDERVHNPMTSASGGRHPQNDSRLQRELDLENALTEDDKDKLGIKIADIKQNKYPRGSEDKLRQFFGETWGQVIVTSLEELYPFAVHIKAVNTVLKKHDPYTTTGVNQIAKTALVAGQGLRYTLLQQRDKKLKQGEEDSNAEKAWKVLQVIEKDLGKCRARLYLKLNRDPNHKEIEKADKIFECFRSSAFQTGLFMAFAYMKSKMKVDKQEFASYVAKWIKRINEKFEDNEGVRKVLFDISNLKSLRYLYRPRGGLTPTDWPFFRYLILELLSVKKGKERTIINAAKVGWRKKLYIALYNQKKKQLNPDENEQSDNLVNLHCLTFREIADAFKNSFGIDEEEIERDVQEVMNGTPQPSSEIEDEEADKIDDLPEEQ